MIYMYSFPVNGFRRYNAYNHRSSGGRWTSDNCRRYVCHHHRRLQVLQVLTQVHVLDFQVQLLELD